MRLTPPTSSPWWQHAFAASVRSPDQLARSAWLLCAHRSPLVRSLDDVEQGLRDLQALAASAANPSVEAWRRLLFVELGLSGNGIEYHDVRNSFLPDVLTRRVGIPISLAVIGMEVGRRMGLPLEGVGAPGHFLLRLPTAEGAVFLDPFHGGTAISFEEIRTRFHTMFGDDRDFTDEYLAPSDADSILVRMLANLKTNYARLRDLRGLRDVLRLRSALPAFSATEACELARLHQVLGDDVEAVQVLDQSERLLPLAASLFQSERARLTATWN